MSHRITVCSECGQYWGYHIPGCPKEDDDPSEDFDGEDSIESDPLDIIDDDGAKPTPQFDPQEKLK